MIVVDSHIIAYLLLPGEYTERAERLYCREPNWIAPQNWKIEFLDILRRYELTSKANALSLHQILIEAEKLMERNTYEVTLDRAFSMARRIKSESNAGFYLALAEDRKTPFYTLRKEFLNAAPELTINLVTV